VKNKTGMSLIEMLITTFILFFIMGSLFWMVMIGKTTWQASLNRSGGRQDIQTNLWRIAQELGASRSATFTNNTGGSPSAFSFLSAYDQNGYFVTDAQGQPVWQKYEIYYIPAGSGRLLNREVYGSFTQPLTLPQLLTYLDGSGKQVASGVEAFTLTLNANKSADLTLTINNLNRNGKTDRQILTTTASIRN